MPWRRISRLPAVSRATNAARRRCIAIADLTLKSKRNQKETEARNVLTQLVDGYPASPLRPAALMMKARIEEEQRLHERDAVLATSVPSALITYRRLIAEYPDAAGNEIALQRMAEMYEDAKRFELAATSLVELATRYPASYSDCVVPRRGAVPPAVERRDRPRETRTRACRRRRDTSGTRRVG